MFLRVTHFLKPCKYFINPVISPAPNKVQWRHECPVATFFQSLRSVHLTASVNAIPGMHIDKPKLLKEWQEGIAYEKLTPNEKKVHDAHLKAVLNDKEVYKDPFTTYEVFTILAHLNRGECCGNACRHCPYKHVMVEAKYRQIKVFNSAFYS